MKRLFQILILIAGLGLTACDYRYRTSDSGASGQEVKAYFEEVLQANSFTGTQRTKLQELYEDPNTYLYFAQWANNHAPMGPLDVVAPMNFEAVTGESLAGAQLESLKIFYLNRLFSDGTSEDVLVLQYKINGQSRAQFYSNLGDLNNAGWIQGKTFSAVLNGPSSLLIESYDVEEGALASDIQLKIYDANDGQTLLGKIPNLEGFILN